MKPYVVAALVAATVCIGCGGSTVGSGRDSLNGSGGAAATAGANAVSSATGGVSSPSSGGASTGGQTNTAGANTVATGGAGGVVRDASSGGAAGAIVPGDGGPDCGATLPGPAMVEVPAPQGGWFCIDSTEVTNSDYAAFVSSHPDANGQKPECAWNTTYEPAIGWPATGNLPVVEVDWCDAAAYCAWAGKRLCGRIGGGPNAFGDYAVAAKSQWYDACSMAGKRAYPYGDAYRASTCNGYERGAGGPLPVGQMPSCQGGYDGIFDLSGNVDEWEDSCNGTSGASDSCQFRGGSYNDSEPTYRLECDWAANSTDWFGTRESHGGNLGFRCCAG